MEMFNLVVRAMLNQMIDWYIGVQTNFNVNTGKMGKYYKRYLPAELYNAYANTYSDSNYNNFWSSIFSACELFRITANVVSEHLTFTYNEQDDKNMITYLENVKNDNFAKLV